MLQDKFGDVKIVSQDCVVQWRAVTEVGFVAEAIGKLFLSCYQH